MGVLFIPCDCVIAAGSIRYPALRIAGVELVAFPQPAHQRLIRVA
jgi:hypothetical protein